MFEDKARDYMDHLKQELLITLKEKGFDVEILKEEFITKEEMEV